MSQPLTVLLASGSACGTIAAVRNLGANGINVAVISSQPLSAAAWSRWAFRSYRGPAETKSQQFLDRLVAIGKGNPGQILLPTSDETAWLYTANANVLEHYFRLYQPPPATIKCILDKKLLAGAALRAGISTLPSWDPRSAEELAALAPSLPYPILIKPRTHVHRLRNDKGMLANSAGELMEKYSKFVDQERNHDADSLFVSDTNLPILQQFVAVGSEGVLSVSGFIDQAGEHFVTRLSTKVFQRSWPVGVGVCFESRPAVFWLSDIVRRLCRDLGYFGIFEVEFLSFNGSWAMIDFNPRLFNQVGMDISRKMPLPLLACLDAAGATAALRLAAANAQSEDEEIKTIFYDRFTLRAILFALTITGRMSRQDRLKWYSWTKQNAAKIIDVAADASDPIPAMIHVMSEIWLGLRAFPRFLRSTSRRRALAPNVWAATKKASQ